jgi:hypothetical protein
MRLVCQKAFFLALVVTLACHEVSGPPPFPADYVLDNINGRALPTFVSPIPEGPTIVSAELHLDGAGRAEMTEHRHDINQGDLIVFQDLDYRITGTGIEIGCLRVHSATAQCPDYVGTISESTLSLSIIPNQPVVYNYKITPRTVGLD